MLKDCESDRFLLFTKFYQNKFFFLTYTRNPCTLTITNFIYEANVFRKYSQIFIFHLGLQRKKAQHYYIDCIFLLWQVRVAQVYNWIYQTHMLNKYKHCTKSWKSNFAELRIPLYILNLSFKIVTEIVKKDGKEMKFRFKQLNTEKGSYKISIKTIIKKNFYES